jgi:hypothetical protein
MGTVHTINRPRHPAKPQRAAPSAPQQLPKPVLDRHVRLTVEQARCFLMQLDGKTDGADLPVAMYLLGRLAEHAQNLLDVVDANTALPR